MSQTLLDSTARLEALDVARSFIVQAPAGSGKTTLLVERYLRLLETVEHPEEVVAITFTRKAAAEMRHRVLMKRPDLPSNRLRIQTIDALCQRLVHTSPQTAQVAHFTIADDTVALYKEAALFLIQGLPSLDEPVQKAIASLLRWLDNDLQRVLDLLADLLAHREEWAFLILTNNNRLLADLSNFDQGQGVNEHSQNEHNEEIGQKGRLRKKSNVEDAYVAIIEEALVAAKEQFELRELASILLPAVSLSQLPAANAENLEDYKKLANCLLTKEHSWRKQVTVREGFPPSAKAQKAAMHALLKELAEEDDSRLRASLTRVLILPEASFTEDTQIALAALVDFLPTLLAALQVVFAEDAQIDFSGVAEAALQSLGREDAPSDLALALDYQIKHLLVDEFQDTSTLQFALIRQLVAGWMEGDGHTVFLVGDPMQSIYGFRGAKVGLFLSLMQQQCIASIPLQPLTLQMNFRAAPQVVTWYNTIFSQIFPKTADASVGAVMFSQSVSGRSETGEVFQHRVPVGCTADALLATIKTRLAEDKTSKIAVLVRAKYHLQPFIALLKAQHIPYEASELEDSEKRPVIQDLLALTRWWLHPEDAVSLCAVLRAPWCGLTLADLCYVFADPQKTHWQQLLDFEHCDLAEEIKWRLRAVMPALTAAYSKPKQGFWAEEIHDFWQILRGPECLASRLEVEEAENYFDALAACRCEAVDPVLIAEQILRRYTPPKSSHARVSLMTFHKAKGLEFDVVLIPHLEKSLSSDDPILLSAFEHVSSEGDARWLLAPIQKTGNKACAQYEFIKAMRNQSRWHEEMRLLYVAATRAKRALYWFAELEEEDEPSARSLLSLLWPAIKMDNVGLSLPNHAQTPNERSLYRLPADLCRPDQACSANPSVGAQTDPAANHLRRTRFVAQKRGEILHRLMQSWSSLNRHCEERILRRGSPADIESWFFESGLLPHEIKEAHVQIDRLISTINTDPKAQWILHPHADAKSEWPLRVQEEGAWVTKILDRTFVHGGVRWVVDYKFSAPHSDAELAKEIAQYQPQLLGYRDALLKLQGDHPIRMALYFPLVPRWVEL